MDLVEFIFRDFWHFIGILILLYVAIYFVANLIINSWPRFLRMLMIRKHGWPPSHLDADGDWKNEPKKAVISFIFL